MSVDDIDTLMKGPLKEPPSIIVVGDDDVIGFTPARNLLQPLASALGTPRRG
jgi:hypothetical protein